MMKINLNNIIMTISFSEYSYLQNKEASGEKIIDLIKEVNKINESMKGNIEGYYKTDIVLMGEDIRYTIRYCLGTGPDLLTHMNNHISNYYQNGGGVDKLILFVTGFVHTVKNYGIKYKYIFFLENKQIHSYFCEEDISKEKIIKMKNILAGIERGFKEPVTTPNRVNDIVCIRYQLI